MESGFVVRRAGQAGRERPLGLPVATKFATYEDVVSAIVWSTSV
jgi:hypothetical protein